VKPILDTLRELKALIDRFAETTGYKDTAIALVGGYAVIAHGIERTTKDIDTMAVGSPYESFGRDLAEFLKRELVDKGIIVKYLPRSLDIEDPFQHEIIYLKDPSGLTPRIDIIIATYKWELEGLLSSETDREMPINLLPKPYLIAMKLKAGGPKGDYDVIELYSLLNEEEKQKTHELARLIRKDKRLVEILKPRRSETEEEDESLLL